MKFKKFNTIGTEEKKSVMKVMDTGMLSPFIGAWSFNKEIGGFYGGKYLQKFEKKLSNYFNVKYAIGVNSWTSGLIVALGAIDIEPGDEVIVSPWTMCAGATCVLHWSAIPIFADINEKTFNLDPVDVEKKITKRTKAIIVPEIFGHPIDILAFKKISKKYKIKIITDNAQSIYSKFKKRFTSTFFDVGGLSFNYHKHINTGEGGAIFTNSKKIAEKCYLIRNHGEAVVEGQKFKNINNIVGYNFRLGEIEASIGIEQLKKLKKIVISRRMYASQLSDGLRNLNGIHVPITLKNYSHSFYYYGIRLDEKLSDKKIKQIKKKIREKKLPIYFGYQNIHRLPIFLKKIAYGTKGFPWNLNSYHNKISYRKSICPIAEKLHNKYFLAIPLCAYDFNEKNIKYIIKIFKQIWNDL